MSEVERHLGLRYFNVYENGQTETMSGDNAVYEEAGGGQVLNYQRERIPITGLRVRDVASANISAMSGRAESGFLNIGTSRETIINWLARIMTRAHSLDVEPEHADALPGDVMASRADTSLASQAIPWTYATELDKGLSDVIQRSSS